MSLAVTVQGVSASAKCVVGQKGLSSAAAGPDGSFGNVVFDDIAGTLDIAGWNFIKVEESLCSQPRLATGWVTDRTYSQGMESGTAGRMIDTTLIDVNAVFGIRVITGNDGKRPAETHIERIDWLLASSYLNGLIADYGQVDRTDPRPFEEADYRGQYAMDVLNDIAGPIFRTFFAYWDVTNSAIGLFFDTPTTTTGTCTLSISNVAGAANDLTVFAPQNAQMVMDPSEVYSRVRYKYRNGVETVTNTTTNDEFFATSGIVGANIGYRGLAVDNDRVGLASTARTMGARLLVRDSEEGQTITCTITVPASKVGLMDAGMRILCTFTHLPDQTAVYNRITRRTIRQAAEANNGYYDVDLELSNHGLAGTGGGGPSGGFPNPPATAPTYSQAALAKANPASSTTQTVTLSTTSATDVLVGFARAEFSGIGHTITWPAGWTVLDHSADGAAHYGSLAYITGVAVSAVTATVDTAAERFIVGVVVVAGGDYERKVFGDLSVLANQPLITITPDTGLAAVVVAFQAVNQAVNLNTDPSGYTRRLNDDSNTGGNSTRLAAWTKAIDPTTGAASTGTAVYAGAVEGVTAQVVISGASSDATPSPGQWVFDETPTPAPGGGRKTFTTLHPFADRSLRVWVDHVEQTAAITTYNGATGTFTLAFDPRNYETLLVSYQGR